MGSKGPSAHIDLWEELWKCWSLLGNMHMLMHTVKPAGVAVSHCRTWFQTHLIPTTYQIRYHSHFWDAVEYDQ